MALSTMERIVRLGNIKKVILGTQRGMKISLNRKKKKKIYIYITAPLCYKIFQTFF
jgi:hypothetical protein